MSIDLEAKAAFAVSPAALASPSIVSSVRLRPPAAALANSFGLLQNLPGTWIGTGFNLIWRPNFPPGSGIPGDHFLELNLTQEITKFTEIGAPIPNRGLAQADITLFGISYLQQVSDAVTLGALHIEPGIWLNIPATTQPAGPLPNAIARLSTIPHGNALVAQGQATTLPGAPTFPVANIHPFPIPGGAPIPFPETNLSAAAPARSPLPPASAIPLATLQNIVNNPNSMLTTAIAGQHILNTTVLEVATAPSILLPSTVPPAPPAHPLVTPNGEGGIENIAFLNSTAGTPPPPVPPFPLPNAIAASMFATFWIEEIQNPFGAGTFFQLQYSQTVYLNFATLTWPHVSVATLVRSSVVA